MKFIIARRPNGELQAGRELPYCEPLKIDRSLISPLPPVDGALQIESETMEFIGTVEIDLDHLDAVPGTSLPPFLIEDVSA